MAVDLLETRPGDVGIPEAGWLAARLCQEAGVCLHDKDGHGNAVRMDAASYERGQGLVVTDENGRRYRLRVTAEPLP